MQVFILLHLLLFMVLPFTSGLPKQGGWICDKKDQHEVGMWPRYDFDPTSTSEEGIKNPKCRATDPEKSEYSFFLYRFWISFCSARPQLSDAVGRPLHQMRRQRRNA